MTPSPRPPSPARRGPAAARARGLRRALPLPAALFLAAFPLAAAAAPRPAPPQAADTAILRGRVVRGGEAVPVGDRTVVLHRVEADSGAAVDSVRTGADGRFSFRLAPAEGVVHLASVRYEDVLYFGPAVHGGRVPADYAVRVWEARRATAADTVRIRRRSLVVEPAGDGLRVMDVVDASAGARRTLSRPEEGARFWWGVPLPDGAREVRVLPGGLGPEEVRFEGGEARVAAALPPRGVRLVLGYRLPGDRSLVLPPGPATDRLEVVARGGEEVTVEGLRPAGDADDGGERVRRWVSAGPAADTVRVGASGPGTGVPLGAWIAAAVGVLAAGGAAAAWWARERRNAPVGPGRG